MNGSIENIHPDLLEILKGLEEDMGFELTITSGQRSIEHNTEVEGVPESEHTEDPAQGADVLCKQSITRYKMLKFLFEKGVKRIGVGETFIHVGISESKPQYVVWDYYPKTA